MHPKAKAIFDKHKEIDPPLSAIDEAEKKFLSKTKHFKKVETIDQLWRTRKGGIKGAEYLWYLKKITSEDYKGNKIAFVKPEGKWEMPILNFVEGDNEDGDSKATGVASWQEMYDFPFSKEKVEEFQASDLISEFTQFNIDTGPRKYGGFTLEMFLDRDFDDLVYFGQNGKFPTKEEKEILTGPPSKRMGLVKNA